MNFKEPILNDMNDIIEKNNISGLIKENIEYCLETTKNRPIFFLKEIIELEEKFPENPNKFILKLYIILREMPLELLYFDNLHKIITEKIFEENILDYLTRSNIKKIYKLFIKDFPKEISNSIFKKEIKKMGKTFEFNWFIISVQKFTFCLKISKIIIEIFRFFKLEEINMTKKILFEMLKNFENLEMKIIFNEMNFFEKINFLTKENDQKINLQSFLIEMLNQYF